MVVPKIEPEKLVGLKHSTYEIYVGKLKDTLRLDNVGDYSLKVMQGSH